MVTRPTNAHDKCPPWRHWDNLASSARSIFLRSHRTHSDSAESMAASLNNTYHYLFQPQEIPQRPPGSFATSIIDAHSEVGEPGQQTPKASAHPGDMRTPLRISAEPATPHPDHSLPSVPSSRMSSRMLHPDHLTGSVPASSTSTQKSVSPGNKRPRQLPTLVPLALHCAPRRNYVY